MMMGGCSWKLFPVHPMMHLASPWNTSLIALLEHLAWTASNLVVPVHLHAGTDDSSFVFARMDSARWVHARWVFLSLPPEVICELPVSVLVKLGIWIWSVVDDDWGMPCFCVGFLIPCGDCDDCDDCVSASLRTYFLVLSLPIELVRALRLE